jgi:hypothetical protein
MKNQIKSVILMDNDDNLKGTDIQIIHDFGNVVVPQGEEDSMTLMKLVLSKDVASILAKHNAKRVELDNKEHRKRHGQTIKLEAITIEDVTPMIG